MRLKRELARRAVLLGQGRGTTQHRHATWLELFFDLAYVAAIGQVASNLTAAFETAGLFGFVILFVPLWWAWVGQAFYLSRFDSDDWVHRASAMVQIVLVVFLAVAVPEAAEGNHVGFILGYVGLRAILVLQYLVSGAVLREARALTTRHSIGFALAIVLWIDSLFLPQPLRPALWGLAILVDFVTPFTCRALAVRFPPDYSHIPERFGLFTIIVLGEAVLATVAGLRSSELAPGAALLGLGGLVIAFALWWIYFDGVRGDQVRPPTSTQDVGRLQVWLFSHLPLGAGIVLAAVGVKKAIAVGPAATVPYIAFLIGASLFTVMVALHAIYWSGIDQKHMRATHVLAWPHVALTFGIGAWALLAASLTLGVYVGVLVAASVGHVFFALRELPSVEEAHEQMMEAKRICQQTAARV